MFSWYKTLYDLVGLLCFMKLLLFCLFVRSFVGLFLLYVNSMSFLNFVKCYMHIYFSIVMCTNRVVILLIFVVVVISVVGLQFYVLVCILKRDIIPIYIYFITFRHRHTQGKRTNYFLHS